MNQLQIHSLPTVYPQISILNSGRTMPLMTQKVIEPQNISVIFP